jgi:hypothetical protein
VSKLLYLAFGFNFLDLKVSFGLGSPFLKDGIVVVVSNIGATIINLFVFLISLMFMVFSNMPFFEGLVNPSNSKYLCGYRFAINDTRFDCQSINQYGNYSNNSPNPDLKPDVSFLLFFMASIMMLIVSIGKTLLALSLNAALAAKLVMAYKSKTFISTVKGLNPLAGFTMNEKLLFPWVMLMEVIATIMLLSWVCWFQVDVRTIVWGYKNIGGQATFFYNSSLWVGAFYATFCLNIMFSISNINLGSIVNTTGVIVVGIAAVGVNVILLMFSTYFVLNVGQNTEEQRWNPGKDNIASCGYWTAGPTNNCVNTMQCSGITAVDAKRVEFDFVYMIVTMIVATLSSMVGVVYSIWIRMSQKNKN